MNEVFNHLWQSTAFAAAIVVATLALRKNSPRVRYWFWVWRSVKRSGLTDAQLDEAVPRLGNRPGAYARSIVQDCSAYVESPLACASGIGGADLKKRVREIMLWRGSLPVMPAGKVSLALAAVAAVSVPFVVGVLRAQTLPPVSSPGYDVVSIRRSAPDGKPASISPGPEGGLRTHNTPVLMLIEDAYGVHEFQIIGAPGWASSQEFDVTFTPDKAEAAANGSDSKSTLGGASIDRDLLRLQAVLRDRFGLVLRSETRELPVYNLVVAKGGAKLSPPAHPGNSNIRSRGGQLTGTDVTVGRFAELLSTVVERPVLDFTHLSGSYDFKVVPDADETVFTALPEQVGLKLESAKGSVQVYVVEKLQMPSEN